jgi:hypothetical protein
MCYKDIEHNHIDRNDIRYFDKLHNNIQHNDILYNKTAQYSA